METLTTAERRVEDVPTNQARPSLPDARRPFERAPGRAERLPSRPRPGRRKSRAEPGRGGERAPRGRQAAGCRSDRRCRGLDKVLPSWQKPGPGRGGAATTSSGSEGRCKPINPSSWALAWFLSRGRGLRRFSSLPGRIPTASPGSALLAPGLRSDDQDEQEGLLGQPDRHRALERKEGGRGPRRERVSTPRPRRTRAPATWPRSRAESASRRSATGRSEARTPTGTIPAVAGTRSTRPCK